MNESESLPFALAQKYTSVTEERGGARCADKNVAQLDWKVVPFPSCFN